MNKSKIEFDIALDDQHIPEKILWSATDNPQGNTPTETKAVSISLWDHQQKQSLRMDLWAKDMTVDEMKKFYIECIAGIGDSIKRSTDDELMAREIHNLCEKLVEHVKSTRQS